MRRKIAFLVFTVTFFLNCAVAAQMSPSGATPEQNVARLMYAVTERSNSDIEEAFRDIQAAGEKAIPAITAGMTRGDDQQRLHLVRALGGIAGDSSTSLLVEAVAQTAFPKSAERALSALENRTVRRDLTSDELTALTNEVGKDSVMRAGNASRVLAKCVQVPMPNRLEPIIVRFKRELESPGAVATVGKNLSYVSPRVQVRNQFLLAFSYIDGGIERLTQEKAAASAETGKWWTLALGFAGDKSVSVELREMISTEPDRYIRCVAVNAYSRSAGRDAAPLLKSLVGDTTESEYGAFAGRKALLIRNAAKDALARLKMAGTIGP